MLLSMDNISKSYGAVHALQNVSLALAKGEIRGLVGENGAGKSTLMKILSGAVSPDAGHIRIDDAKMTRAGPAQMLEAGIAVIYQEFAQAAHLSIAENISLGRLPRTRLGAIDWASARRRAADVLAMLGYKLDVNRRIGELSVAQRQIVEIARAIARNARLIVLDEPSAVLGDSEINRLFELMRKLRDERGVGFIYVSHRLHEVFEICSSVTILRDGRHIETAPTADFTRDRLIKQMVGRDIQHLYPERGPLPEGQVALEIIGLDCAERVRDINLTVREGEIVGLCGLSGAGRSEVLMAAAGADAGGRGEIRVFGNGVAIRSPRAAINLGIGFVPEDRKTQGLCLGHSVGFNMALSSLRRLSKHGVLDMKREAVGVRNLMGRMRVKAQSIATKVGNLSGGNQQKCLIGRQLMAETRILLIDEPTRGVDIGARREIYDLLTGLARNSKLAILMVSSELPEVLGLCDRIYVMREGRIAVELSGQTASEEEIMKHAAQ
ncbi:sugar ABC transporter ATP-binding protein [Rhizobium sp.]